MNNILDGEKDKVSKTPFSFKRLFQKIKSSLKLGMIWLRMMPKDKLAGIISSGIFFFWGLIDFIHYMYLWICVYHWIGYTLIIIILLPFVMRLGYLIYKGIENYFHYKKMAKIYKKVKDIKDEQNFSRKNILND